MQKLVKRNSPWQWLLALCVLFVFNSCNDKDPYDPYANFDHAAQAAAEETLIQKYLTDNNITNFTKTPSGLYHVVKEAGAGEKPKAGQQVEVTYIGRFIQNGQKFDSSHDRGQTFKFVLGQRQVIPGWDEGLTLMQKGEKALLLIPSRLAYGLYGNGPVPSNTPIMFEVHLLNF
ncbi:FKBP-type peptidyl-prolyl cis-trans isomerase [Rufibacter sediminis]|uniref:Peptidyl-prolyl cis-trans isomerase n=1 Tax=Rufibacter sediminis TaxID=2762756 RepID=A0ABR6VYF3_9BACT|nr:FKBP-type peptidyl-prolyl cis-trans isomerase [Rufibacter sediminis]MBC3541823.1 FKBP-type peptidyl-prolyl cis-trans isomerase [Rufibacter sediminis]